MAKRPQFSAAELESQLGLVRPIRVDSNNRQSVRKWLLAWSYDNGTPFNSGFVYGLSMTELGLSFNDPNGQSMANVLKKWDAIPADERDDSSDTATVPATTESPRVANDIGANGEAIHTPETRDIESAIRAIAASVVPKASGIDAEAVRAIIRNELPNLIPVTRIEIVAPEGVKDMGEKPMHKNFPLLVKYLAAGLHVMLVGPAGSGKTTAAEMAFTALSREFRIQGNVSGEHSINGYCDAHGRYLTTPYRDALEHGHGFIADEFDGWDPNGSMALHAGMANGYAAFPDSPKPIARHANFLMVGCANTWSLGADRVYVGRNQMDGATRDRFVFLDWDYDETLERALCPNESWLKRVQSLRHAAFAEKARLVISPRASMSGARLLAAGVPSNQVEDSCIWKGADAELRRRIEDRARNA